MLGSYGESEDRCRVPLSARPCSPRDAVSESATRMQCSGLPSDKLDPSAEMSLKDTCCQLLHRYVWCLWSWSMIAHPSRRAAVYSLQLQVLGCRSIYPIIPHALFIRMVSVLFDSWPRLRIEVASASSRPPESLKIAPLRTIVRVRTNTHVHRNMVPTA